MVRETHRKTEATAAYSFFFSFFLEAGPRLGNRPARALLLLGLPWAGSLPLDGCKLCWAGWEVGEGVSPGPPKEHSRRFDRL